MSSRRQTNPPLSNYTPLSERVRQDANAGPGIALGHLHMRGPRHGVPPQRACSCGRIVVRPPQLVLPICHLPPQRPHHELLPTQRPHLQQPMSLYGPQDDIRSYFIQTDAVATEKITLLNSSLPLQVPRNNSTGVVRL